ncbi:helix-turn-helix domain-containing protein [Pontibacter sp. G13]|uniref:helix-turn-helix domain-containing protein n=1 Tax=Pontibacter sp. G13 TaxID=3074898 RepID=UPI00288B60CF|nr:helix-turn-helix domain-containing protein [Pontibacter sp. G13]WNJ18296.1 helix-turn-helix domain-containing protein [Pontibacter sp. G13]
MLKQSAILGFPKFLRQVIDAYPRRTVDMVSTMCLLFWGKEEVLRTFTLIHVAGGIANLIWPSYLGGLFCGEFPKAYHQTLDQSGMKHFKSIQAYCEGIGIDPPLHPHFDIRSFEENMDSVHPKMPAFRHECYAIAIKADGDGKAVTGQFADFPDGAAIFFNSPFQLISWDIVPNWKGYYLMFDQDFIAQSHLFSELLTFFPFLKIGKTIPFTVPSEQVPKLLDIYHTVWAEYHGDAADRFDMIEAQVYLLLRYVKRLFEQQVDPLEKASSLKAADLKLLSRYQALIETSFYPEDNLLKSGANLHSTSYYAEKLSVHPNHLNAVVKGISGITALNHIHNHLLALAKSHLAQTDWSVKEIAYSLHFDSPNNFSAFFKRRTDLTPLEYRQQAVL